MALEAGEHRIIDVFREDRHYRIPDFQRPYSWEFENAYQLIDDLLSAWRDDEDSYFLGSIVVVKDDPNTQEFDVIDGQQRLITLTLLLAVLRDSQTDQSSKDDLTGMLTVKENSISGAKAGPRLQLRDPDDEFYREYIVGGDLLGLRDLEMADLDSTGQRHIRRNIDAILEALGDVLADEKAAQFLQYVAKNVYLVVVTTSSFVSAHRIFGVLNRRGMPLSAADIFKAQVIGAVQPENRGHYAQLWDEALEPMRDSPDAFFQHLLVLTRKTRAKRSLIEDFAENVLDRELESGSGEDFIDKVLLPHARAYALISAGVRPSSTDLPDSVLVWLDRLAEYPSQEWKPVAMWAVARYVDDAEQLGKVLKELERVFGVYSVARVPSEKRSERMIHMLRYLDADASNPEDFIANSGIPDDVRQKAVLQLKGDLARNQMRKLVLSRAHMSLTGKPVSLGRSVSVASIVPAGVTEGISDRVDRTAWRNKLGALVLLKGRNTRVEKANSWDDIRTFTTAVPEANRSIAVTGIDAPELTNEELTERHNALVSAVAGFWAIIRDSDGVDLTKLTEAELVQSKDGQPVRPNRRIQVSDVVATGIMSAGDTFVWKRPSKEEEHRLTVTEDGRLQLDGGSTVDSASAASREAAGTTAGALDAWCRESDGQTFRDLWETYRRRFGGRL